MSYIEMMKGKHMKNVEFEVTFTPKGAIYINAFIVRNFFTDIKFVLFRYNKEKKFLAIKPMDKESENTFRLCYSSASKSTGIIQARTILKKLNINLKKSKTYPIEWVTKGQFFRIRL